MDQPPCDGEAREPAAATGVLLTEMRLSHEHLDKLVFPQKHAKYKYDHTHLNVYVAIVFYIFVFCAVCVLTCFSFALCELNSCCSSYTF